MLDVVLYNGTVLTHAKPFDSPRDPRERLAQDRPALAQAVGIREGRIATVGTTAEVLAASGAGTKKIDLAGRTLVPGLNDAHAHIWKIGHLLTTMLDLRRVGSIDELVRSVKGFGARLPRGAWLLGRGYNEAAMTDERAPTRADLDRAEPSRPVVLTRTCGHIYAVNSAALEKAGIGPDSAAPAGGEIDRDERGRPTGLLRETAMGLMNKVMPPPSAADYERMIVAGLTHQLTLGITSSSDCGVSPPLLDVYRALDAKGGLPSRVNVMPLRRVDGVPQPVPLPPQHVSDRLRVDTVKFLADGGLSGATAALSEPYRHLPTRGLLRFENGELRELCGEAHRAGWRIATHAIGDVAIDQMLDVYEALGEHPRGFAHRIEHFGLPDAAQLARAAKLRVIAAPQTIFIHSLGLNFRSYLPESFLPRTYPVRAMLDAGVRVALSSDAPVVEDDNPMVGMMAAVTRLDNTGHLIAPAQAITSAEALHAYTMGGAIASGDEDNRGSIEPGKWADLAVLTANPLTVSPEKLPATRVDLTLVAGRVVFER